MKTKSNYIITLIFFAFILLMIFVKTTFLGSDNAAYIQGANALLQYNIFSSMGEITTPDNFRTIGYPLIIASAMLISSSYYINIVITIQVLLLYFMMRNFISLGGLLNIKYIPIVFFPFMLHPELINLATSFQTEFMYIFTLFLFFVFTLKYLKNKNYIDLILSAMFLSLSLHIKPVYLFFVLVYLAFIFIFDRKIKNVLIVLLTMLIVIGPWVVRNKLTLDTYSFTSSKNFNLLCYAYSVTKAKYNLSDLQAVKKVDNLLIDKYNLETNTSILDLVASQNNELINDIIPIAAKDIIFENIEYLPRAYIKGLLRGFYLPHTIYGVDENSSIHISNFIAKVKQKDIKSILIIDDSINYSVIYFYILPYILNLIVILGLVTFSILWLIKKQFRTYQTTFILLFVWYGISVAFPWSNNSRYMMAYFPQMAIMFLYSLNFLYKEKKIDGN